MTLHSNRPLHLIASYLVVNAQSEVFPLPSHSQTPAAQPRLLSLVHASGKKRTPLKLLKKEKLSEFAHMCCSQWCEQPVCSCRECRHAGFFFPFFIYSSVPVEAACCQSSSSILKKNILKSPFACMCGGGCDTDLYVPPSLCLSLRGQTEME